MISVLILVALLFPATSAGIIPASQSYQTFEKNLAEREKFITNYFACCSWNTEFCKANSKLFKTNEDGECIAEIEEDTACINWYRYMKMCLECQQNWKTQLVYPSYGSQSSVQCVPENQFFLQVKGNICIKCKEGFKISGGLCVEEKQEPESIYDIGCWRKVGIECKICRPYYYKINGLCTQLF